MTVYIVTYVDYDGNANESVWLSKTKAEAEAQRLREVDSAKWGRPKDRYDVEEHETHD